jgi:antitoxin ChpS
MHPTNLRKVGGSVMLAVPPALLDQLSLKAGDAVGIAVEDGRLVVARPNRPRYTLDELLAGSDYGDARSAEDQDWIEAPPAGREIL